MSVQRKKLSPEEIALTEQQQYISVPTQQGTQGMTGVSVDSRPTWLRDLPLDHIEPNPFQARKRFSDAALEELADSIRAHGLLTRIRVRPHPSIPDFYQLVYGERRLRAARLVGLPSIPCEVGEYTDDELKEIGLIENLQREDLDPLEEAKIFRQILEQKEYSYRTLAERIGKHKSYIEDRVALLGLPDDVIQILEEQPKVSLRALIEVAKLPTVEAREPVVRQLRTGMMSTEDVRTIVREVLAQLRRKSPSPDQTEAHVFNRVFHKATRRMDSALEQLREAAALYASAPDVKKRDMLSEHVQNILREARRIEDMLQ